MPDIVEQGSPITLDLTTEDSDGGADDASIVRVSILDASGATVENLATPTHVSTGFYQYTYPVPGDATPGAWAARWFATINGFALQVDDGFTVVRAGSVATRLISAVCQPWAVHGDVPAGMLPDDADPDDVDDALLQSSDLLFELTGRRFPGQCHDVIRPQSQWRKVDGLPRWWPALSTDVGYGAMYGWCSCRRGRETGCSRVSEIKLPGHPVDRDSITVKVDGVEFTDWTIDDGRFLRRVDGEGWPCCQDLDLPDSEEHTFSIAYDFGRSPVIGGKNASILLGVSIYAENHPDVATRCKPPARATTITRQGVTIQLGDPVAMVEAGLTGIRSVDLWVASVFRGEKTRRGTVLVPGKSRSARRVR